MQEIIDYLNTGHIFMPHGHCYQWRPDILYLHIVSDIVILLSYYSIPAALVYFAIKRKSVPYKPLFWLFGAFIFLCGTTHGIDIWTTYSGQYRIEGIFKALTAIASFATAIVLWPLMPTLLKIPTIKEMEDTNEELQILSDELEARVLERTQELENERLTTLKSLQKLNEQQILTDQERDRFLVTIESLPNGLLVVDENGMIVRANNKVSKFFGYSQEELNGMPVDQLVPDSYRKDHPDKRNEFFQKFKPMSMGKGRDLYGKRKDSTLFPVEIALNPFVSNEKRFVICSIVDISVRKISELAIKTSEEKYRTLFERSYDAILILDLNCTILDANQMACDLFQCQSSELIGLNLSTLMYNENAKRCFASEGFEKDTFITIETKSRTFGKGIIDLDISASAFELDGRNYIQVLARDITEKKQFEAIKDQFAGKVAHELRTPVAIVGGIVENFQDGIEGEINDSQAELLGIANQNIRRLQKIINDLLDITRIETGGAHFYKLPVDIQNTLTQLTDNYSKNVLPENIQIKLNMDTNHLNAFIDEDSLYQIVNNILNNAVRYAKTTIEVKTSIFDLNDDYILFEIIDDGPGIPKDYQEIIFDKYIQTNSGKEDSHQGMGLGLTICKELVEAQDGKIWIETNSTKDSGAHFIFTLPKYNKAKHLSLAVRDQIFKTDQKSSTCSLYKIEFNSKLEETEITKLIHTIKNRFFKKHHHLFSNIDNSSILITAHVHNIILEKFKNESDGLIEFLKSEGYESKLIYWEYPNESKNVNQILDEMLRS